MSKKNLGSSIDQFLKEEKLFEEAQAQAIKEVVAWQLAKAMKKRKFPKHEWLPYLEPAAPRWTVFSIRSAISPFRVCSGQRLWLVSGS
jgi:hypothetical protein